VTPYQYAVLCAERYSIPPSVALKGRGHSPRVKLEHRSHLYCLLPSVKITERDESGAYSTERVTMPSILDGFRNDLMAAGIDLDTADVVQPQLWSMAQAVVRLTGEPLTQDAAFAVAMRVQCQREAAADRELSLLLQYNSL
jgi:hypothetical protein